MATKSTIIGQRWRPDTCTCVLTYDWDTTKGDDDPSRLFNHIAEQKCELHALFSGKPHYDAVLAHCRAVNAKRVVEE